MTDARVEPMPSDDAAVERIVRARHEALRDVAHARNMAIALKLLRRPAPDAVHDALRELRAAADELAAELTR